MRFDVSERQLTLVCLHHNHGLCPVSAISLSSNSYHASNDSTRTILLNPLIHTSSGVGSVACCLDPSAKRGVGSNGGYCSEAASPCRPSSPSPAPTQAALAAGMSTKRNDKKDRDGADAQRRRNSRAESAHLLLTSYLPHAHTKQFLSLPNT